MSNKYDLHIGESSWDLECLNHHNFNINKSFLHNDYFAENVNFFWRLYRFFKIFFLVLIAVIKRQKIIFTSINSDSMLVQILFIWYKKTIFLLPNILGYKKEKNIGSRIYRYLIKNYKNRVIATDEITHYCLKDYGISVVRNPYRLESPKKWNNDFYYFIIFPTPGTHKDLKNKSEKFFRFYLDLFDFFDRNFLNVFIMIHPRDRGETYKAIKKLRKNYQHYSSKISNSEYIKTYNQKSIYISGLSSMCLNKRYGGRYSALCSINGKNILKDEFKEAHIFLTDVSKIVFDND